jgi:hypothetical protein
VQGALADDDVVFFYKIYRPNINYYMGRNMKRLDSIEEVGQALETRQRIFLVLENRRVASLDLGDSVAVEQVERSQIGSHDMICVEVSRALPPS